MMHQSEPAVGAAKIWSAAGSDSATPLWQERSDAGWAWLAVERKDRRAPPAHPKAAWRCRFPPHSKGWRHVRAAFLLLIQVDSLLITPPAPGIAQFVVYAAGSSVYCSNGHCGALWKSRARFEGQVPLTEGSGGYA